MNQTKNESSRWNDKKELLKILWLKEINRKDGYQNSWNWQNFRMDWIKNWIKLNWRFQAKDI